MSVTLKHETLTDVNLTIVTPRRYREPYACPVCNELHEYKTYHLALDSQGKVDVSDTVYERLAELEGLPIKKTSKRKPKPQVLSMSPAGAPGEIVVPTTVAFVPKSMKEQMNGG